MFRGILALAGAVALSGCSLLGSQPEQELDDLILGVHYVGITVPDVDASAAYYEAAFDVERMGADELDGVVIDHLDFLDRFEVPG